MKIVLDKLIVIGNKFGCTLDQQTYVEILHYRAINSFLSSDKTFINRLNFIAINQKRFLDHPSYKTICDEINKKLKLEIQLTEEEKNILEVMRFFDEIAQFQNSPQHNDSLLEQTFMDESRLIPLKDFNQLIKLSIKTYKDANSVSNYLKPIFTKTKKKANQKFDSLVNIYSVDEFRKFMEILANKAKQQRNNFVILFVSDTTHISSLYEAESQSWLRIWNYDLQPTPTEFYELVEIIINCLENDNNIYGLQIKLFAINSNKKEINELVTSLKMPFESRPSNYGHYFFLEIKKKLGYETDIGLCFGFATMAIQAHLCGPEEFEKFKRRIDFIALHPDFFSEKKSGLTYRNIKHGIITKRDAAREHIKLHLKSSKQPSPKYIPVELELTEEEQNALEIAEFFEGVAVLHNPEKYADKINKSLIGQSALVETFNQIQSQKLESIGGIYEAALYIGIYNYFDICKYIEILHEKSKDITCNYGILIAGLNHAISILYEATDRSWTFVDANTMRIIKLHPSYLSERVFRGIEWVCSSTGMQSTIFSSGQDRNQIQKLIAALQDSDKFKKLHSSNNIWVANNQYNLIFLAARTGLTSILTFAANSKSQFINELLDKNIGDYNPTLIATASGKQEALQILVDAKTLESKPSVDLNKKTTQGETASYIAASLQLSGILQILINARNDDGSFRANLDLQNIQGKSPIWIALEKGHHDILQMLASAKYDDGKPRVNLDVKFKNRPLVVQAFLNSDLESFKILEEHGASINIEIFDPMQDSSFYEFLNALKVKKEFITKIEILKFDNNVEVMEDLREKLKLRILHLFRKDYLQFSEPDFKQFIEKEITILQSNASLKVNSWVSSLRGLFLKNEHPNQKSDIENQIQRGAKKNS